jgi:hypothetical protein
MNKNKKETVSANKGQVTIYLSPEMLEALQQEQLRLDKLGCVHLSTGALVMTALDQWRRGFARKSN